MRGSVITAPQHLLEDDVRNDQLTRALRRAGADSVRRLGRRDVEPRERRPRTRRVVDRQYEAPFDPHQLVGELVEVGTAKHVLAVVRLASGLDADLLDGQDGSYYANIVARLGYTPLDAGSYSAGDVRAKLLSVDGAGSGLDADLLDGRNASEFALLSGAAFSGPVSTPGPVTAYVAGRGGAKLEAPGDTNPGYVGLYDGAGTRGV